MHPDTPVTPDDVECPLCWARPGEDCIRAYPFTTPHAIRVDMAERAEMRRVSARRCVGA